MCGRRHARRAAIHWPERRAAIRAVSGLEIWSVRDGAAANRLKGVGLQSIGIDRILDSGFKSGYLGGASLHAIRALPKHVLS